MVGNDAEDVVNDATGFLRHADFIRHADVVLWSQSTFSLSDEETGLTIDTDFWTVTAGS
jgi:hypothetical protein